MEHQSARTNWSTISPLLCFHDNAVTDRQPGHAMTTSLFSWYITIVVHYDFLNCGCLSVFMCDSIFNAQQKSKNVKRDILNIVHGYK